MNHLLNGQARECCTRVVFSSGRVSIKFCLLPITLTLPTFLQYCTLKQLLTVHTNYLSYGMVTLNNFQGTSIARSVIQFIILIGERWCLKGSRAKPQAEPRWGFPRTIYFVIFDNQIVWYYFNLPHFWGRLQVKLNYLFNIPRSIGLANMMPQHFTLFVNHSLKLLTVCQ